jgi:outer membrane receptor protein involved in Fe transport
MNKERARRVARVTRATSINGVVEAALLALAAGAAQAAEPPAPAPAASAAEPGAQRVEVVGSGTVDDRRASNASKTVVSHEDLTRYGDRTVADALQRVPGVSVVRVSGRDAEIRLRGLAGGYTQILVDGQPVPSGFSIESLSPELIDHVDVLRSATADMSTQSIAGSINIVMRRPRKLPPKLKASLTEQDGRPTANASLDVSGRIDAWSWALGTAAGLQRDYWPSVAETRGDAGGRPAYDYTTITASRDKLLTLAVTPQLTWQSTAGSSVNFSGLLQARHTVYDDADWRASVSGTAPELARDALGGGDDARLARGTLQWKMAVGTDGRLDSKLTVAANSRRIHASFDGFDADDGLLLNRAVHSTMRDDSTLATGKYSLDLGEDHTLAIGWDGQSAMRNEHRVQVETSPVGFSTLDLDQAYTARIARVALFTQDEWTVSKSTSAYLGIRWEGLHTRTTGNDIDPAVITSSVFSPTLQGIWKIPGAKQDQVRVALGRTYKAPTARDLVPRLWVTNQNGPTTPDFKGNPSLRPELAWGLDASYEHYLPAGGLVTLGVYARQIKDVVIQRVYESDGTWIQSPVNAGGARVAGLEFEAKDKLAAWLAGAPDIDLRLGATRNWSRIDDVPGPGNRLTQQPIATLSSGLDWHAKGAPVTLGASFVLEHAGYARTALTQSVTTGDKRLLDVYAAWKMAAASQLRLTATNVLALHTRRTSRYFDADSDEAVMTTERNPTAVRLQFETTF